MKGVSFVAWIIISAVAILVIAGFGTAGYKIAKENIGDGVNLLTKGKQEKFAPFPGLRYEDVWCGFNAVENKDYCLGLHPDEGSTTLHVSKISIDYNIIGSGSISGIWISGLSPSVSYTKHDGDGRIICQPDQNRCHVLWAEKWGLGSCYDLMWVLTFDYTTGAQVRNVDMESQIDELCDYKDFTCDAANCYTIVEQDFWGNGNEVRIARISNIGTTVTLSEDMYDLPNTVSNGCTGSDFNTQHARRLNLACDPSIAGNCYFSCSGKGYQPTLAPGIEKSPWTTKFNKLTFPTAASYSTVNYEESYFPGYCDGTDCFSLVSTSVNKIKDAFFHEGWYFEEINPYELDQMAIDAGTASFGWNLGTAKMSCQTENGIPSETICYFISIIHKFGADDFLLGYFNKETSSTKHNIGCNDIEDGGIFCNLKNEKLNAMSCTNKWCYVAYHDNLFKLYKP